jgi:hypothetical protein
LDFFFDFDFFAFFAFFAFLAIASSFGLMEGNATRGMLGGGPASQHPRMRSQQIRGALPRTVTALSLRYPQLMCVFGRFSQNFRAMTPRKTFPALRIACSGVNDAPTRRRILHRSGTRRASVIAIFIISKPQPGLLGRGQSPLSEHAASCGQQGVVMGGSFDNSGGRARRALRS